MYQIFAVEPAKDVTDVADYVFDQSYCQAMRLPFSTGWHHWSLFRRDRSNLVHDLPGEGDEIDGEQLGQLAAANARRPAIVFTHKPPTAANLVHLRAAADKGLHINLSADSLAEADELASTGLSVVTILSSDYGRKDGEGLSEYRTRRKALPSHTPAGLRIAICPATFLDVTCVECQVCSRPRGNGTVMGFPAHASRSGSVDVVFMANGSGSERLPSASGWSPS